MISSQTRKNDVFAKFRGEEANANHILYGYIYGDLLLINVFKKLK